MLRLALRYLAVKSNVIPGLPVQTYQLINFLTF